MSLTHPLQQQRYELKYLVPESLVLPIRDFVRSYLVVDEYGRGNADFSYEIHSLYFDSAELATYQSACNGDKDRFKLRMRYYDDRPEHPVFFELKRRMNAIVLKDRCPVRRADIDLVAAGHLPPSAHTRFAPSAEHAALEHFCQIITRIGATPKSQVTYIREAWVSAQDNSVRVTMDKQVRAEPRFETRPSTAMANPTMVFPGMVVLELKFTNRFPNWFADLTRAFGLMQCGAAKYANGILLRGEHHYQERGHTR